MAKTRSLRKRILRLALRLFTYFVLALLVFNGVGIYVASHMPRLTSENAPLDFGMKAETISITTGDGITLKGWFVTGASGAPAIVFLHGLGTVKGDLVPLGRFLHQKGYTLLFFDFRNCGESEGTCSSFGANERLDLEAALDFLRSRKDVDAETIGLVGVSLGSAVAADIGAREPAVKAMVLDSAFPSAEAVIGNIHRKFHLPAFPFAKLSKWMLEAWFWTDYDAIAPISAVRGMDRRGLLIISGGRDPIMRPDTARKLYEAAPEPKEFWLVPEAGHVGAYECRVREYEKKVGDLFGRFLPIREIKQPQRPDEE